MTNVLNPQIETREAASSRFFNTLPIPSDTLGIIENFEVISAVSTEARAKLETFTQEQFEEYDVAFKRGKLPEDDITKQRVITIDRLLSDVHALPDAASVIEKEGSKVATYFVENYNFGIEVIGQHVYWMQNDKKNRYLCVSDEENGLAVYFNRIEQFSEPGARAAGLQDYLNLLRDICPTPES